MNNPLIDPRAMNFGPWQQETIWIQRNELGHIVGMSEHYPNIKRVQKSQQIFKEKAHQ